MTNTIKNKVVAGLIVCSLLAIAAVFALIPKEEIALSSVVVGNDYQSEQLTSTQASGTAVTLLKTGGGTLGSIVITVPAATGNVKFYDYASTTATTSSALMLGFTAAADVAGTYTFDSEFATGLTIDVPAGFDGQYTVTWR